MSEKPKFGNDPITDYIRANPEHSITVCMNVQHSDDKRLRVTFEHRQGPYRPRTLGVYVEETIEAALEKLKFAQDLKDAAQHKSKKEA